MHEQLTFKSTSKVYAHVYAWELTFKSTPKVYAQEINLQKYFQVYAWENWCIMKAKLHVHELKLLYVSIKKVLTNFLSQFFN